jgi:hypothetical protein
MMMGFLDYLIWLDQDILKPHHTYLVCTISDLYIFVLKPDHDLSIYGNTLKPFHNFPDQKILNLCLHKDKNFDNHFSHYSLSRFDIKI